MSFRPWHGYNSARVLRPENRFPTLVLAAGAVVLLISIAIGERMGTRVLGQATEQSAQALSAVQVTPQPEPEQTVGPFGPDWKRTQTLSAASDPGFPDPRVPPKPLPTAPPPPTPSPTPVPTATINPNIPIWRQQPLPTASPSESPAEGTSPEPSGPPPSSADVTPSPS
jgi:hypothetical protein